MILRMLGASIVSLSVIACARIDVSEVQLSQNVWQIQADGRGGSSRGKTMSALFKRAAELTLEKGYTHFILESPETKNPISSFLITGGSLTSVYLESSSVLVRMSRGSTDGALDASSTLESLK